MVLSTCSLQACGARTPETNKEFGGLFQRLLPRHAKAQNHFSAPTHSHSLKIRSLNPASKTVLGTLEARLRLPDVRYFGTLPEEASFMGPGLRGLLMTPSRSRTHTKAL